MHRARRLRLTTAAAAFLVASAPLSAQQRFGSYPAARMGGNYMHNYYLPPAVNSTPWYPSWSPDGRRIAFVSDRSGSPQVYVMNSDGSDTRRLTYQGSYNTAPAW